MSNGSAVGASTQAGDVADHAIALDALLTEAENERRPVPSDISDIGDESSQLTELEDEDETAAPDEDPVDDAMEEDGPSEEGDDDNDLADTEAETECLEISPQKLNNLSSASRAPRRLQPQDTGDYSDEELDDDEQASRPNPQRLGIDTTAMPAASDGESSLTDADDEVEEPGLGSGLVSKKRKRSMFARDDASQTTTGTAKKRSASSARGRMSLNDSLTATLGRHLGAGSADGHEEAILEDDESDIVKDDSAPENAAQDADAAEIDPIKAETVAGEEESEHDLSEPPEDLEQMADPGVDAEDPAEEGAEDDDADAAVRTEEELAKKRLAMEKMIDIEKYFAIFRDKLYDEKLAALDDEKTILEADIPEHPEYLSMLRTLDQRRDEKIRIEQATLRYKEEALKLRTLSTRAIAFGQYFQTVRALREDSMRDMNGGFSGIQRERRSWKVKDPQFVINFPPTRQQQVANQVAYNKEVSLLSGIARHVGFPAAPEIKGASASDIEDDLGQMKIRPQPSQYVAQVKSSTRAEEAIATQKFIEQNAWANPDHPSHRQAFSNEETAVAQAAQQTLSTPYPNNRKFSDVHQSGGPVPGSGSTIDAPGSGPPSGAGALAYARDNGPASSPFEQFKQRMTTSRPSPGPRSTGPLNGATKAYQAPTLDHNVAHASIEDTNADAYTRNSSRPFIGDALGEPPTHDPQINRYPFSSPLGPMASQSDVVAGSR